jgi:hypothetical protein
VPTVTCGQVRAYLSGLVNGRPVVPDPGVWDSLLAHGAVSGSASAPQATAVGRHVLTELEIRSSRVDSLSLDVVAGQLSRVLEDLDHVARTAEYFLAELGPLTPPEAIALLRPVAVALANRRETPEELAQEFRNTWGSVEVMGGYAADRLLAAELLTAASAPMEKIYAPLMTTATLVRQAVGDQTPAVATAAILHLWPLRTEPVDLAPYLALRAPTGSEQGAALLAGSGGAGSVGLRDRHLAALGGPAGSKDHQLAATYLATVGADPTRSAPRVAEIARGLAATLPHPITAAAVLSDLDTLSPAEVLNWVEKATDIVRNHTLAPTPAELTALAAALVHGLPRHEFDERLGTGPDEAVPIPALVALYSWVYRPLVLERSATPAVAAP